MERKGYIPAIQGGGTGTGFQTPVPICTSEPEAFQALFGFVQAHRDGQKQRFYNFSTLSNDIDRFDDLRFVWNRELERRLQVIRFFCINQGKWAEERTMNRENMRLVSQQDITNCSNGLISSSTSEICNESSSSNKLDCIVQLIPGLPRTIDEVATYWRRGCALTNFTPLRKLLSAANRRELIHNYKNDTWVSSGQKSALNRHKKLVKLLTECTGGDMDADSDDDVIWKTAIRLFEQKWQKSHPKLHLSTILKDSK